MNRQSDYFTDIWEAWGLEQILDRQSDYFTDIWEAWGMEDIFGQAIGKACGMGGWEKRDDGSRWRRGDGSGKVGGSEEYRTRVLPTTPNVRRLA